MIERELLVCSCGDIEHQLVFSYFPDDVDKLVYVSVYLNPDQGIFKRIWSAIKYIFGYRSKYGHFDEFILDSESVPKLNNVVRYLSSNNSTISKNDARC